MDSAARRSSRIRWPGISAARQLRAETRSTTDEASETLRLVRLTLDLMADGGIYDQVGGGFHRYSTDTHLAGAAF